MTMLSFLSSFLVNLLLVINSSAAGEQSRTLQSGPDANLVPYENHPYSHHRRLQQGDSQALLQPIRIIFDTQNLEDQRNALNSDKIDFLIDTILPQVATFWSHALSVIPVSGNLPILTSELVNQQFCGSSTDFNARVPQEHISNGIPDTDLVIYVSGTSTSSNATTQLCVDGTLGTGISCNYDQFDRPTAGAIHICWDQVELDTEDLTTTSSDRLVEVLTHEMGHILGLSSERFRFFWDSETGMPRTPRPFTSSTATCVDGTTRSMILPSENTLQFVTAQNGQRSAAIVTPKVRAVVRNQFDCQSLPGARLENLDIYDDSSSCFGSNWEQRDYYAELMTSTRPPTGGILTPLTLALLEDSGWYQANYPVSRTSSWGLGAGCKFVEGPCLTNSEDGDTIIPEYSRGYFCSDETSRGCSPSLSHKLACSIVDYAFIIPDISPEEPFQYFPSEPSKGGHPLMDYCPVYSFQYNGLEVGELACVDPSNANTLNIYSEVYGADSKCIPTAGGDGRCYRTACDLEKMTLKINVRGEWLSCEFDFQEIDVRVGAGALPQTIICPRLSSACPELFCNKNCEGRGVCNFVVGECEPFAPTIPPTDAPVNPSPSPTKLPSTSTPSTNPTRLSITSVPTMVPENASQSPSDPSILNGTLAPSSVPTAEEDSTAYGLDNILLTAFSASLLLILLLR